MKDQFIYDMLMGLLDDDEGICTEGWDKVIAFLDNEYPESYPSSIQSIVDGVSIVNDRVFIYF